VTAAPQPSRDAPGEDTTGLRARPGAPFEVVAVLAAAVDQLYVRAQVSAGPDVAAEAHRAWRFSGRWWSPPLPTRRPRPWVGRSSRGA